MNNNNNKIGHAIVPEIIVAKKPVVLSLFYSDIDGSSSVHKV